jgi:hypothetical protein
MPERSHLFGIMSSMNWSNHPMVHTAAALLRQDEEPAAARGGNRRAVVRTGSILIRCA